MAILKRVSSGLINLFFQPVLRDEPYFTAKFFPHQFYPSVLNPHLINEEPFGKTARYLNINNHTVIARNEVTKQSQKKDCRATLAMTEDFKTDYLAGRNNQIFIVRGENVT